MIKLWTVLALCAACGDDAATAPDAAEDADAASDAASDAELPASAIRINEVMPSNLAACADQLGGFADYVELYNPSAVDIDLGGYTVTDDPAIPLKATLLPGLIVPAGGYRLLWCDDDTEQGPDHVVF